MSVLSRIHIASAVSPLPSIQDVADAHTKKKRAVLTTIFHLKQPPPSSKLLTRFMVAVGIYHWITCLFVILLVLSQLSGAIWDSTMTEEHVLYGQSPLLGPSQIIGDNDIPYADRVVACVGSGEFYEPKLVSSLLKTTAIIEDSTGKAIHGYRVKQRNAISDSDSLDSEAQTSYEVSCGLIARTIENIFKGCLALGYTNLTLDNLRVVDDWDSEKLYFLPHTLPILIMPYWDNAPYARHAIPTWGGDSCVFRLEDGFIGTADSSEALTFHGVNQSIRHERTAQWLNRLGGVWKNGWYEDKEGVRWYSDVTSSAPREPYFMMHRVFNMQSGDELNCSNPSKCEATPSFERWGNKFSSGYQSHSINSIYIANGTEYGLFLYESYELRIIRSVFDWETLLSNLYTGLILHRWASAQFLILKSALQGRSHWCGGGISFVSGSKSFAMLPIMSLPRLKMTLAAFWTLGCEYEGQQGALSDTWFAIYPAIVHFTIIYYSLLNLLARALRRRVSDVLFMPTVIILCLLHYFRLDLAQSGLLEGVDGRIETIVFSDDVDKLQLADYFTTDIAWRLDGRVHLIFNVKLAILAVNLLPLCFARPFPSPFRGSAPGLSGIEKALALRVKDVGGLGTAPPYILAVVDELRANVSSSSLVNAPSRKEHQKRSRVSFIVPFSGQNTRKPKPKITLQQREVVLVSSYELIRLGYLVFGENYLTTFHEWAQLSALAPFRAFFHLWNHRVLVWTLRPLSTNGETEVAGGRALESSEPQMWRLDDPRLQEVKWWQVSACSIQC